LSPDGCVWKWWHASFFFFLVALSLSSFRSPLLLAHSRAASGRQARV
jgi:hypothetical protein